MRRGKLETIVAAIRKDGSRWCDEPLLDRLAPLPMVNHGQSLSIKKLPDYLESLAEALATVLPEDSARSFAGSLTLLRVLRDLDAELRRSVAGPAVRQSTVFELTTLYGALLAARMLSVEALREVVLGERSLSPELRLATLAEVTADVVRRYASTVRGLPMQEAVSSPSAAKNLDAALDAVSAFLRARGGSFVARTDQICHAMGIAS